jgi:hypothetical protein
MSTQSLLPTQSTVPTQTVLFTQSLYTNTLDNIDWKKKHKQTDRLPQQLVPLNYQPGTLCYESNNLDMIVCAETFTVKLCIVPYMTTYLYKLYRQLI